MHKSPFQNLLEILPRRSEAVIATKGVLTAYYWPCFWNGMFNKHTVCVCDGQMSAHFWAVYINKKH